MTDNIKLEKFSESVLDYVEWMYTGSGEIEVVDEESNKQFYNARIKVWKSPFSVSFPISMDFITALDGLYDSIESNALAAVSLLSDEAYNTNKKFSIVNVDVYAVKDLKEERETVYTNIMYIEENDAESE